MKRTASRPKTAILPLTIGTPYGVVRLLLEDCRGCGQHFNFRIVETPPALSTRAAEPFLWKLANTLESVGHQLWMDLTPPEVEQEIELDIYIPSALKVPRSGA